MLYESEAGISTAAGPMVFQTKLDEVIPRTFNVKSFEFKKPQGFKHLAGQWAYFSIKIGGTQKGVTTLPYPAARQRTSWSSLKRSPITPMRRPWIHTGRGVVLD